MMQAFFNESIVGAQFIASKNNQGVMNHAPTKI
jgi:hypothetical protein